MKDRKKNIKVTKNSAFAITNSYFRKMVIVKCLRRDNRRNLMGALFLLFSSLVSIECFSSELSSNVEGTASNDMLNNTDEIFLRKMETKMKEKENQLSEIGFSVCIVGEECTIICPVSPAKNESNTKINWYRQNKRLKHRHGQTLNRTFENPTKYNLDEVECHIRSNHTTVKKSTIIVKLYENLEEVPIIIGELDYHEVAWRSRTYYYGVEELDELIIDYKCNTYNAAACNFTWLHDGKIIEPNYNFRMSGEYLFILVSNMTEDFYGNYTCLVNSPRGNASISGFLFTKLLPDYAKVDRGPTVMPNNNNSAAQSKPFFITAKKPNNTVIVLPAQRSLDLKCPAGGIPTPNITWLKDGKESEPEFGMVKYRDWSMSIDRWIPRDSGNYTCIVCNELGCINSTYNVRIVNDTGKVYERPSIKEGFPKNITATIGSSASFSCPPVNELDVYTRWIKSTCVEIEHLGLENVLHLLDPMDEIAFTTNKHFGDLSRKENHTLVNLTKEDDGWYSCLLSSDFGEVCKSAYLKVDNATQHANPEDKIPNEIVWAVLAVILPIAGAIIIIFVLLYRYIKREKERRKAVEEASKGLLKQWTKKIIVEKRSSTGVANEIANVRIEMRRASSVRSDSTDVPEFELPVDADWEFPRERLTLGNDLGEGNFGRVVKAEAQSIVQENVTTTVAVKMLKESHSDSDMLDLVQEMEILKMIGKHDNVLNLLGCCTQRGDLLVILPYVPHGSLKDFLGKCRRASGYEIDDEKNFSNDKSLRESKLVSFAHQISRGMEYLASKRFVHRDLAARNILVAEHYVMKIADFGLARDIYSDDYYRKITEGTLPIKWMAPEALFESKHTTKSDVWSYGILLWEIMTLGGTPYPSVPDAEFFDLLRSDYRMEKPPHCSIQVYSIMRDCWSYRPNDRPTFSQLVEKLERILTQPTSDEYCMENPFYISTTPASQEYYIENPIYISATPPSNLESSDTEDQTHDKEYCIENPNYIPATSHSSLQLSDD